MLMTGSWLHSRAIAWCPPSQKHSPMLIGLNWTSPCSFKISLELNTGWASCCTGVSWGTAVHPWGQGRRARHEESLTCTPAPHNSCSFKVRPPGRNQPLEFQGPQYHSCPLAQTSWKPKERKVLVYRQAWFLHCLSLQRIFKLTVRKSGSAQPELM